MNEPFKSILFLNGTNTEQRKMEIQPIATLQRDGHVQQPLGTQGTSALSAQTRKQARPGMYCPPTLLNFWRKTFEYLGEAQ